MEDIIIKLLIVAVVTYLLLRIVAAICKIPVHTYAEKLKCARDTRIVNKNLVRVPDLPTTTIMEKLRETIPFANSKIEEKDGMLKITCVVPGVRKKVIIGIQQQEGYFVVKPISDFVLGENIADRIEDALSMACWNTHLNMDINSAYDFNKWNRWWKTMGIVRFLANFSIVALIIAMLYMAGTYVDYAANVRESKLADTTGTIGYVFDEFFGDSKWSNVKATDDRYMFVEMTGKCYFVADAFPDSRKEVNAQVDFLVTKESGTFMIQSVKIDGVDLDYTSMNSFIDDVYKDHMAVHNYDSLGSILEDFGNVIGGTISDSLYGHYVSYYSDTSSAQTPTTEAGQSAATTPETVPQTAQETSPTEASTVAQHTEIAKITDYSGPFDVNSIIDTEWSKAVDDMTTADMIITENDDGSLHLEITLISVSGPAEMFEGDSREISGTEMADLYILFKNPDYEDESMEVSWTSMDEHDIVNVYGSGPDDPYTGEYEIVE